MFFIFVTFVKRAPQIKIIIHLARNAEKGGGVLMSIVFRNLNRSFICLVPDSGFRIRFRIPAFPYARSELFTFDFHALTECTVKIWREKTFWRKTRKILHVTIITSVWILLVYSPQNSNQDHASNHNDSCIWHLKQVVKPSRN